MCCRPGPVPWIGIRRLQSAGDSIAYPPNGPLVRLPHEGKMIFRMQAVLAELESR